MTFIRRKRIKPCFGISARTGLRVGSRHRWPSGWGQGRCRWCERTLEDVTEVVRIYPNGEFVVEESHDET